MSLDRLTEMYRERPAARELFDSILRRGGVEENRTTVDELMDGAGVSRNQAIKILRELARHEYGEFKIGRKGHPSRLEWSSDPVELAEQVVNGEGVETEPDRGDEGEVDVEVDAETSDDGVDEDEPTGHPAINGSRPAELLDMFPVEGTSQPHRSRRRQTAEPNARVELEHAFHLRRDHQVVVRLPSDLSAREAEVLADWIRNLSFER